MKYKAEYLFWLIFSLLLFFKALYFLDPDFGWHYAMGKQIASFGIPLADKFSYSMPHFLYIDHEWLTDLLLFKIYNSGGMIPLALIWTVMGLLIVKFANSLGKYKNYTSRLIILFLTSGIIFAQFGIRPQVISWFLFTLLIWLLQKREKIKLGNMIILLLFLLWANLHGAFVFGLIILALYVLAASVIKRKISFTDIFLLIGCLLVTIINPYGFKMWVEVFSTFLSGSLRGSIEEWKPFWRTVNYSFPAILAIGTVILTKYFNKIQIGISLAFVLTIFLSLAAIIHMPFLVAVTPIIISDGLFLFNKEIGSNSKAIERFNKALDVLLIISFSLWVLSVAVGIKMTLKVSESSFYPKAAVEYLITNLPVGEVFSSYDWGGYLIWKLPQKKVFIDGRMAHWEKILKVYTDIITLKTPAQTYFDKYNVRTVLWSSNNINSRFIKELVAQGWVISYIDKTALILTSQ